MSEYIIRCSKDHSAGLLFIGSMEQDEDAFRQARSIMKLCDFARAEIWRQRRMICIVTRESPL